MLKRFVEDVWGGVWDVCLICLGDVWDIWGICLGDVWEYFERFLDSSREGF